MGDFNNWKRANDETSQMYYDKDAGCWWIILNGLDSNKEYAFQYYLGIRSEVEGKKDTELRLADPYTEKILDAGSDPYIPESTYPSSQMVYPSKGAGVVSTFKINKYEYQWAYDDYRIKNKNSLVIYELLLRDFSETKDLNGAIQKLDYLSELGVTAIELLPVQEFEGNSSWGYNPCFYFAMDKAYGTRICTKSSLTSATDAIWLLYLMWFIIMRQGRIRSHACIGTVTTIRRLLIIHGSTLMLRIHRAYSMILIILQNL